MAIDTSAVNGVSGEGGRGGEDENTSPVVFASKAEVSTAHIVL